MQHIEDLKAKWQAIDLAPDAGKTATPLRVPRHATLRINHYLRTTLILCILGLCLSGEFFNILNPAVWFRIYYCSFFAIGIIEMLVLRRKLWQLTPESITVVQAIRGVEQFSILRNRFKILNICIAIPLLTAMFIYIFNDISENSYGFRVGGIVGGIVGLALGLWLDYRCRRDLRLMREYLGTASLDETDDTDTTPE